MLLVARALFVFILFPLPALAGTVYAETKSYQWQWGRAPWEFDGNIGKIRDWLSAKPKPQLLKANPALRKETIKHFELEPTVVVKYAVLAPPRSSEGHSPYFFAWIEWSAKSDFIFDLDYRRFERKAGVARVAMEGAGEKNLDIREWHEGKDLTEAQLDALLPGDAAMVARKMLTGFR